MSVWFSTRYCGAEGGKGMLGKRERWRALRHEDKEGSASGAEVARACWMVSVVMDCAGAGGRRA